MVYEKACINDTEQLTELRSKYLLEDYGDIPGDTLAAIKNKLPAYFREHLNKDLFVFVCRDNCIIISCVFLYVSEKPSNPSFVNGKTGTVMNVYTEPMYRRKGIAGELIRMMLSESAEMQLDFVELQATEDGYSLYKSAGFEDVVSKYHNMKYIIEK